VISPYRNIGHIVRTDDGIRAVKVIVEMAKKI
jgi:hypothetical protein